VSRSPRACACRVSRVMGTGRGVPDWVVLNSASTPLCRAVTAAAAECHGQLGYGMGYAIEI
jgi:hypothetical protein